MIKADFYKHGGNLHLTISGHAGYSDNGDDIVCAAVSGIFYALVGYLSGFSKGLKISRIESGFADIECSYEGEEAMKLACLGLIQLELTYIGFVKVNNSIWNWRIAEPS